jgi:LAO/AO transport system kinase
MVSELEKKITEALEDSKLSCPMAFKIAKELKVTPKKVGEAADEMSVKICRCQLGCFK